MSSRTWWFRVGLVVMLAAVGVAVVQPHNEADALLGAFGLLMSLIALACPAVRPDTDSSSDAG